MTIMIDAGYNYDRLREKIKEMLTGQLNLHGREEEKLAVFDQSSVYLPTKKIDKNNPLADEIRADNEARQDWNRTADLALVVGVPEEKVLEIKHEEIQNRSKYSISEHGWLPGLFRTIVQKAKSFLELLIRQAKLPPKPKPGIDKFVSSSVIRTPPSPGPRCPGSRPG